jgi:serine/threonine protein kinase
METFAGYELGKLLGRGGMGTVYAARQPLLDVSVAVKLLHPELAAEPTHVERFRTEALAGSRLSHPNVTGVVAFGVTPEGTPFLVMEHVAGERLRCMVQRQGALPPRRACEVVIQILAALDAAHAAGVIHADVKSDNVLVDTADDGHDIAKLIDFGIARLVDRPAGQDSLADRVLSGTPEYLAPEIIVGVSPTVASDLYAAGIVLYELLTGSTPFHGGSIEAIFWSHLHEEVVAPSLRRPGAGISPMLDRVVLRALAKDPAMRHASAAQFVLDLCAAMPATEQAHPDIATPGPIACSTEALTQELACRTAEPARRR